MRDTELRGILLETYYGHRKDSPFQPEENVFDPPILESEIIRISKQLDEHGLIKWTPDGTFGSHDRGCGQITALGIDVVEGELEPPIGIKLQNIYISSSSNIQIGDQNIQDIKISIENIIQSIDKSSFSPKEKAEAKSKLKEFLKHPLVASVLGAAASALIESLSK